MINAESAKEISIQSQLDKIEAEIKFAMKYGKNYIENAGELYPDNYRKLQTLGYMIFGVKVNTYSFLSSSKEVNGYKISW